MAPGWLGLPLVAWGALCLAVSVVWIFLWPAERAVGADGVRFFLIRWGHSAVWLLLAAMCFMRGSGNTTLATWAGPLGLGSLVVYLAFLAAMFAR